MFTKKIPLDQCGMFAQNQQLPTVVQVNLPYRYRNDQSQFCLDFTKVTKIENSMERIIEAISLAMDEKKVADFIDLLEPNNTSQTELMQVFKSKIEKLLEFKNPIQQVSEAFAFGVDLQEVFRSHNILSTHEDKETNQTRPGRRTSR